MGEATCVLVWAPNEEEILSQNVYPIILWIRRMKVGVLLRNLTA